MKKINPHDRFFKETFSKKEEVQDLINNILPKQLINKLDFTSLQLDNTSYIDEELKENFSDLVYDCKYKGKKQIKISILLEHKSYTIDYPHIQLLKYLLKIWETNIKQKQELIPVIPIILYHGKKKWKAKKFTDYFTGIDKDLEQFLPGFEYLLTDLSFYTDEEIRNLYQTITVRISLLLMKNIFEEIKLWDKLPKIFSEINTILETDKGEKFLVSVFSYLYYSTKIDYQKITKTITSISKKGGKITMTTATKLINEGIKEGMLKNQKDTIIKLYQKAKFTIQQIVEYLEIDKSFVEKTLKENGLITG